jgi:hypothetical protein
MTLALVVIAVVVFLAAMAFGVYMAFQNPDFVYGLTKRWITILVKKAIKAAPRIRDKWNIYVATKTPAEWEKLRKRDEPGKHGIDK